MKSIKAVLWISLILGISLHLLRLIGDFDFFWHLGTGRWILDHFSLPHEDPFSFTSGPAGTERKQFILTSYWLSQTIYYLIYLASGWPGIIASRFIVVAALMAVIFKRRDGVPAVFLAIAGLSVLTIVHVYPLERPQVFSFLFFGVLMVLLDVLRRRAGDDGVWNSKTAGISIPVLMLVWANMHGGYVVGIAAIGVYLVFEGLKFFSPALAPLAGKQYLRLFASGVSGILLSFVNPNTWHVFSFMFNVRADIAASIFEHKSTIEVFALSSDKTIILYWGMLATAIAGVAMRGRKFDLTEAAMVSFFGYASFTQMRYVSFFMIAAVPVAASALSVKRGLRLLRPSLTCAAVVIVVFLAWGDRKNVRNIFSGSWIHGYVCPEPAADFIIAENLRGNMYNHYNWGGYLIWRLAPDRKVFIDGRNMDFDLFSLNGKIMSASEEGGVSVWKDVFRTYDIRYVITPLFDEWRGLYGLVEALLSDRDWVPVFFRRNSIIFVKNTPENYPVIRKYSIPKEHIPEDLIRLCIALIRNNPFDLGPRIALGDFYLMKGMGREASLAYREALGIAPFNRTVQKKLEFAASLK